MAILLAARLERKTADVRYLCLNAEDLYLRIGKCGDAFLRKNANLHKPCEVFAGGINAVLRSILQYEHLLESQTKRSADTLASETLMYVVRRSR